MSRPYSINLCRQCKHFVHLSKKEIRVLSPLIKALHLEDQKIWGACLKPVLEPRLLIRQYLNGQETGCVHFEKGFYEETLGIQCEKCHKGEMVIKRPRVNSANIIMIACNHFPECDNYVDNIQLPNRCRNCHTPLRLVRGDILKVVCPKCMYPLEIPVSIKIWPAFSKPEGGCVHFSEDTNCQLCDTSRKNKKNLIDLELTNLQKYLSNTENLPKIKSKGGINELYTSPDFDVVKFMTNGKISKFNLEDENLEEDGTSQSEIGQYYASFAEDYYDIQKEFEDESDL